MDNRFTWKGKQISAKVEGQAVGALTEAGEFALAKANETVPYLEGVLQASGRVDVDKRTLSAMISYDTPYAAKQHEDTRLRHRGGRRAKWLQLTLQEQQRQIVEVLASRLRHVFRGMF